MKLKAWIIEERDTALFLSNAEHGTSGRLFQWVPRSIITTLSKKGFENSAGERLCVANVPGWFVDKTWKLKEFEEV